MKYIDADRLQAEIERLLKEAPSYDDSRTYLLEVSAFIDSLQQEQPEVDLEKEIKDYTETLYHETFGNGQGTLDEFDWEDIVQVIDETARYFYELGLNERKEE